MCLSLNFEPSLNTKSARRRIESGLWYNALQETISNACLTGTPENKSWMRNACSRGGGHSEIRTFWSFSYAVQIKLLILVDTHGKVYLQVLMGHSQVVIYIIVRFKYHFIIDI